VGAVVAGGVRWGGRRRLPGVRPLHHAAGAPV